MKPPLSKIVLLQTSVHRLHKQGYFRLWILGLLCFFLFASFTTLVFHDTRHLRRNSPPSTSTSTSSSSLSSLSLPEAAATALLHYALTNATGGVKPGDVAVIAKVISRKCPCNLLIFGLNHESLLWKTLNFGGRTVFLDENEFWVQAMEERHPGIEAYEVQYTTRVHEAADLHRVAMEQSVADCRPVQNLLFSDCRLALNDLPNEIYAVDWDLILVDGPRGYSPESPGRMSAIFTAAVMARTKTAKLAEKLPETEVFVHDFGRQVERLYSEEFLCRENMVSESKSMGHFRIRSMDKGDDSRFCKNRTNETVQVSS